MSRTKHHRDDKFMPTGKGSYKKVLQKEAVRKIRHLKIEEDSSGKDIKDLKTVRFNYW